MKTYDVQAAKRSEVGSSAVKKLKREGMIPGVIYGPDGSIPVTLNEHEVRRILDVENDQVAFNMHFGDKIVSALVKEVQREPVNQAIQHIDLMPSTDVKWLYS